MTKRQIERYLKVKALAEAGVAGEKDAARRILTQLEAQYPGIAQAAEAHKRAQSAQKPRPPATPTPSEAQRNPFSGLGGNWENIFRFASTAWHVANNVAETVSAAAYGAELAEDEADVEGYRRKESLFIRVRIPAPLVPTLKELNPLQKESFRRVIHDKIEEYLDVILEG